MWIFLGGRFRSVKISGEGDYAAYTMKGTTEIYIAPLINDLTELRLNARQISMELALAVRRLLTS